MAAKAYVRALYWLGRREYSRHSLNAKLSAEQHDPDEIHQALETLQQEGYLNDQRLAEHWIESRQSKKGPVVLRQELRRQGIDPELITELTQWQPEQRLALAWQLWRKRYHSLPDNAQERARQQRYLHYRGVLPEDIERLFRGEQADE